MNVPPSPCPVPGREEGGAFRVANEQIEKTLVRNKFRMPTRGEGVKKSEYFVNIFNGCPQQDGSSVQVQE